MRSGNEHAIHSLFVYLLIGIFAIMATLLVVFSARVYRSTVDAADRHNNERLAAVFILNTVRAGDQNGTIRVIKGEESDRLIITETEDGEEYSKVLLCRDGNLVEIYTSDPDKESVDDMGEVICPLNTMRLEINAQGLLEAEMELPDGSQVHTAAALHTGV